MSDNEIPWAVREQHAGVLQHQMLGSAARVAQGLPVGAEGQRRLTAWLEDLRAADAVLHYDPETKEGWFYVPRRPGIDRGLIREPELGQAH